MAKRRIRWPSAFVILFAALANAAADDYADARAELVAAYQVQDFVAMATAAEKSLLARPEYPGALFNLALAYALGGNNESSLATLDSLLVKGIDFGADQMDEFVALRELPGWDTYMRRVKALYEPVGAAEVALHFDDGQFVPEGIAIDEDGDIYLGSIRKGLLIQSGGETRVLSDRQGHWSVFGMRFHEDGTLWFASAAVPQLVDVGAEEGSSGLFQLDVGSGEILRSAVLPRIEEKRVLGDLVISGDGIYTTDSLTGAVYRYDVKSDEFDALVEPGRLGSPQGLVLDQSGEFLYVADYIGGLYRLTLADNSLHKVSVPVAVSDYGIDGLYRHGNQLLAIQNGARPHRVVSFALSDDGLSILDHRVVAANLEAFDEPTLGTVQGDDFYFVANSHWNRFDRENRLPEGLTGPIILKLSMAPE